MEQATSRPIIDPPNRGQMRQRSRASRLQERWIPGPRLLPRPFPLLDQGVGDAGGTGADQNDGRIGQCDQPAQDDDPANVRAVEAPTSSSGRTRSKLESGAVCRPEKVIPPSLVRASERIRLHP